MKSFGTDFIIVNDIMQTVKGLAIGHPPEKVIHHCTVNRGFTEYVVLSGEKNNTLYINKIERNRINPVLEEITDDVEWNELCAFLNAAGILSMSGDKKHAIKK